MLSQVQLLKVEERFYDCALGEASPLLWKTLLGFVELFEEFQSSHLRDELLMFFGGFCPLKVSLVKNSCVHCVVVMNVILLHLSFV